MAKIKFGAIVTDMRNKVGSQVFSRNRYGAYTRGFKINVPSVSSYQAAVKARLASVSSSWASLTQVQRDSWNASVAPYKTTDVFGSLISPSGFDLFTRLNCNLVQIGLSQIVIPPVPQANIFLSSLSATFTTAGPAGTLSFSTSPIPANFKFIVMATACISPGITYVKNRLREVQIFDAGSTSPLNLITAYIARFGSITSGRRISFQILIVNKTTGQKFIGLSCTTIVDGAAGLDFDETLDGGRALG